MKPNELKVGMKVHADTISRRFEVVDLSHIEDGWVGISTGDYKNLAWPLSTILALN